MKTIEKAVHKDASCKLCAYTHQLPNNHLTTTRCYWCVHHDRFEHISLKSDKTAFSLAALGELSEYEQNIRNAASKLIKQGLGHYEYHTQWASGATLWTNKLSGHAEVIPAAN